MRKELEKSIRKKFKLKKEDFKIKEIHNGCELNFLFVLKTEKAKKLQHEITLYLAFAMNEFQKSISEL